jgi:hypothetical protein
MQAGGIAVGPVLAGQLIAGNTFVHASHTSMVPMVLAMLVLSPAVARAGSAARHTGN